MRVLVLAAVVSNVLAGCIGTPDATTSPSGVLGTGALATLRALLADVPCEAAAVDAGTSENVLEVANLPYEGGEHGEIDVSGDWLLSARYQDGGFEVVSLADPARPVRVAAFEYAPAAQDVKFLPDGRSAVVGNGESIALVDLSPVMDAGLSPEDLALAEIAPVLVSEWTYPSPSTFSNMHMLYAASIGDADYVFVAPNDDTGVWILRVAGEGASRTLETVTNVGPPLGGGPLGPHDMTVWNDPILGKPVLLVANGFEGWMAWDVSAPASPARLALVPNADPGQGYTHTIAGAVVDGRRLVVTIAEVGANVLKVFDATDYARPVLLAEWWSERARPTLPQHNVQVVNATLFVAHYTRGVYAFDLAAVGTTPLAGTTTIGPIAHYAPPEPASESDVIPFANVWDVVVERGLLYVSDMTRGTAVVGYGCFAPGDDAASSNG